jgi:hypothetical protein
MKLYLTDRVEAGGRRSAHHEFSSDEEGEGQGRDGEEGGAGGGRAGAPAAGRRRSASRSGKGATCHILFRPIHVSLVESAGELTGLLQELGAGTGVFVAREELDARIGGLLERVNAMGYKEIVETYFGGAGNPS